MNIFSNNSWKRGQEFEGEHGGVYGKVYEADGRDTRMCQWLSRGEDGKKKI